MGNPARLPAVTTASRMPALMVTRVTRFIALILIAVLGAGGAAVLTGCSKEIGDGCTFSTDCSPNGDRICDNSSSGGYCTISGCDYSTCPEEAACVQFFTGNFSNKTCDPIKLPDACSTDSTNCCSLDELCELAGHCVPRSSEHRFCMRKCGSDSDCRDGYECRDIDKMIAHGGQPVLAPGVPVDAEHAPKFCAARGP